MLNYFQIKNTLRSRSDFLCGGRVAESTSKQGSKRGTESDGSEVLAAAATDRLQLQEGAEADKLQGLRGEEGKSLTTEAVGC